MWEAISIRTDNNHKSEVRRTHKFNLDNLVSQVSPDKFLNLDKSILSQVNLVSRTNQDKSSLNLVRTVPPMFNLASPGKLLINQVSQDKLVNKTTVTTSTPSTSNASSKSIR